MSAQTKTPWAVGDVEEDTGEINIIGDGFFVAGVIGGFDAQEANAAFIVRACNAHYDLLEAVRVVADLHSQCRPDDIQDAINAARAAIAKAEGRT